MKKIPDDKKITGISIPGTHDSICRYTDFSFISQTQRLTVSEQLEVGVRYFDFRFKFTKGEFLANHSITFCRKKRGFWNEIITAGDVVNDCIAFLELNPTETVLFQLKESVSHTGNDFYNEFFERHIHPRKEMWFVENRIPAMGEVRGRIVLLRAVSVDSAEFTDNNCGIDFSSYPYVGSRNVDDWRRTDIKKLDGTVWAHMYVQDSYKTQGKHKWETVKGFLESGLDENEFNICCTSCTGLLLPRFNSRIVNNKLMAYDFPDRYAGIIATDFVNAEMCKKIVEGQV